MKTTQLDIPTTRGRQMQALWIQPDKPNPWQAAVIVLHDIFGFTDDIKRIAQRMAGLGYAVLAPDLYDQPGLKPLCVVKTLKAHETGKGYAFDQLDACRRWLMTQNNVAQVGMMGFCMGGRFSILYANRAPLTVVAPFYGGVPKQADQVACMCPTVGGWGQRDKVYGTHGERLKQHLCCQDVRNDIKTYEQAGHSFMQQHDTFMFKHVSQHTPLHAAYDEAAAEDSWKRVEVFFADEFARGANCQP